MKRLSWAAVAFVLSIGTANVFADVSKIGVVDLQKIMQTSSQMKVIQQKLEAEFKPRRDKLVAMENGLKISMEKLKRESAVLSSNDKKDAEKKILMTQQTFERDGQQYQQELSTAHNEAMEDLYAKIRKAITKVAEDQKYDIIIQKDAAPYAKAQLDITSNVIKTIE